MTGDLVRVAERSDWQIAEMMPMPTQKDVANYAPARPPSATLTTTKTNPQAGCPLPQYRNICPHPSPPGVYGLYLHGTLVANSLRFTTISRLNDFLIALPLVLESSPNFA